MITKDERERLIRDWPICKFDCPKDKLFSCDCDKCSENKGYFEKGEMESLFIVEEIGRMKQCFSKDKGWLGLHGCLLAPAYRSGKCLASNCRPLPKKAK